MAAEDHDAVSTLPIGAEDDSPVAPHKVPNSPSAAFAALSLVDRPSSSAPSPTSTAIFTQAHLDQIEASTRLVSALDAARKQPKPLIRSTGHLVSGASSQHHLLSWKVAEFAYRKSTSVGSELPTLARGLFTERIDVESSSSSAKEAKHRIVVRGYDKFFNLGEMAWTKPESIAQYTTAPYVLTFKENGCIIFIAALSPTQLVVTSKHSLGSIEGTEVTHAQKGHEWLLKHLASVGRTEQELAAELWQRNETAAFELCDDSFEEHVLAYSTARSGLHLHGLNSNAAHFSTRSMPDVDAFAKTWGFIPTRWIQLSSLAEVNRVTAQIEQTGAWEGEPIEGFVIRTHMPSQAQIESVNKQTGAKVVSPPYAPGQAWFYKVKFDEPYLMYRDWRELARKMVKEKADWEAKLAVQPSLAGQVKSEAGEAQATLAGEKSASVQAEAGGEGTGEAKSKAALKRERKRLAKQSAKASSAALIAARQAGILPPAPPQPRSKRPETLLFIQWCYDRLYGNAALGVQPQPGLFAGLAQNKGIIAMRDAFLAHLATLPDRNNNNQPAERQEEETREFAKTILAPIAVPGCGKTVLAVALQHLFDVGHVQSDDFKAKKGFLAAVEKDLRAHARQQGYTLFADKNNHLFQHRDEITDLARALSNPNAAVASEGKKGKSPAASVGRVRTVALAWDLDSLPLNTLHRVCAERIEQRGENHQTLVADRSRGAIAGIKSHETVLWRFLEALQPFGSAQGKGEGAEGYGDSAFDHVVRLSVHASAYENLCSLINQLAPVVGWHLPSEEKIQQALQKALEWKVAKKQSSKAQDAEKGDEDQDAQVNGNGKGVRYFGLAVELDVRGLLDSLLLPPGIDDDIRTFYTTMRSNSRLNLRPHITLVHHTNLSPIPTTCPTNADKQWALYTDLVSARTPDSNPSTHVFHITLSQLLYQPDTLLTFPIDRILPPPAFQAAFWSLHDQSWTPHITLATRQDVRPYEANRVVASWLQADKHPSDLIHVVPLPHPITVEARVFGMS